MSVYIINAILYVESTVQPEESAHVQVNKSPYSTIYSIVSYSHYSSSIVVLTVIAVLNTTVYYYCMVSTYTVHVHV